MDKTINEDKNNSPNLNLSETKESSNSDAVEDRESSESNISENQESSESNDISDKVELSKDDSSGIENSKSDEKVNAEESSLEKENPKLYKTEPENDSTNQDSSNEVELTPGRKKLQSWLNKTLCVLMSDDRILVGIFLCTDRDCNIILGQCFEFLPPTENEEDDIEASKESRQIGLVMVPGKHIVKIFIDELGAAATPYSNIVEEDIM